MIVRGLKRCGPDIWFVGPSANDSGAAGTTNQTIQVDADEIYDSIIGTGRKKGNAA